MTTLVLALYAEGRTDERFLPVIAQRTAEDILARQGRATVDVLEPISLNRDIDRQFRRRVERIVEAARRAFGYHALIIHADADHPAAEQALEERIQPGIEAAQSRDSVCHELIPLVPVQKVEAWMLADAEALRQVVGTSVDANVLGLPARPHQVESEPDPKWRLQQAVQVALANRPRRRRQLNIGELYEPLARRIRLVQSRGVPAYRQFVNDLTGALVELGLAWPEE